MLSKNIEVEEIYQSLCKVLGYEKKKFSLHEPKFKEIDKKNLMECIDSGWVSYAGSFVKKFEKKLADYFGVRRAILTVNGTTALHISLIALGINPGEEVLIPSLTFVATANALSHAGVTSHFVEVDPKNLGIDVSKLREYLSKNTFFDENKNLVNKHTQKIIRAIIPVHIFGHPCDMDEIIFLANEFNLIVIEDAAEALGSTYKSKKLGSFGKANIVSFNGNKIITTGGGGAVLTDDEELADRIYHLTTTAKKMHPWEFFHDEIGYNYRLPNLNAALGCSQMDRIDDIIQKKRKLAISYKNAFQNLKSASFLEEPENSQSNYWLNAIILNKNISSMRDDILLDLNNRGFGCRPIWNPLHTLPMYQFNPCMKHMDVTMDLYGRVINIPSSYFLYDESK